MSRRHQRSRLPGAETQIAANELDLDFVAAFFDPFLYRLVQRTIQTGTIERRILIG